MAGIATTTPLGTARTATTAGRAYFNGQNWVIPQAQTPTPQEQDRIASQQQANQNRFTSGVRSAIDDYLNLQQQQTRLSTDATAAGFQAEGYRQEVNQYSNAAQSAESDANIARVSGDIQAFQDLRKFQDTAGKQAAAIAGAGFKASGSAIYLAQDALRRANVTQQLDVTNAQERQVGYLETAAAARSQAAAAGIASTAAENLAAADTAAAGSATTNANALSASLTDYLRNTDPNNVTPEARLSMSALSSSPDANLLSTVADLNAHATSPGTNWYSAAQDMAGTSAPGNPALPGMGGTDNGMVGNQGTLWQAGPNGVPTMRNLGWGIH